MLLGGGSGCKRKCKDFAADSSSIPSPSLTSVGALLSIRGDAVTNWHVHWANDRQIFSITKMLLLPGAGNSATDAQLLMQSPLVLIGFSWPQLFSSWTLIGLLGGLHLRPSAQTTQVLLSFQMRMIGENTLARPVWKNSELLQMST